MSHHLSRVLRGLGSAVALLVGLVGLPVALVVLGGNPLPDEVGWEPVREALFTPDDGSVLLGLITIVGWAAWLVFAASVTAELLALASHQRLRIRLPGLAAPQRLAAGLLVAVIGMLAVSHLAQATPPAPSAPAAVASPFPAAAPVAVSAEPAVPATPEQVAPFTSGPSGSADMVKHRVSQGDDLWSLAERYYGEGREWRKIAAANPDVLSGGPDRLQAGWTLVIPDVTTDPAGEVTVGRGDTLSSIAEEELGSSSDWSKLYDANRSQLSDPDELAVGMRLTLPHGEAADRDDDREKRSPRVKPIGSPQQENPASQAEPPTPPAPIPEEPSASPSHSAVKPATPSPVEQSAPSAPDASGAAELSEAVTRSLARVGGLLAAGLLAGLALRRRAQLQLRPVGRRIAQPPPPARLIESAVGRRQRPLSLRNLDEATRAISAHCRSTGESLPPLQYAFVDDQQIELVFRSAPLEPPVGFTACGRSWLLNQADADYLRSIPGLSDATRPWPALASLGEDDRGRQVVADLEELGLLHLGADQAADLEGIFAAMAVELSFSPWADEMILTLVGPCDRLPDALGKHNVTRTDDLSEVLDRLEQRAAAQRGQPSEPVLAQHRIDPDLADPWAPEIVLINQPMTREQQARLEAVVTAAPRVTMAAVVSGAGWQSPWQLNIIRDGAELSGVLNPAQLQLRPQHLDGPTADSVVDLIEATGSEATTAAPWWPETVSLRPDPPPDNGTFLGPRAEAWGGQGRRARPDDDQREGAMGTTSSVIEHPTLQLIGPVELLGAAGEPPPRAAKQCLEYCAWLLEHPGTTAQAMAAALVVAEGTRRSNMSRLRGWLGADGVGEPYLPDAYTGRILLHAAVSSDWQQLQVLTVGGVRPAGTASLKAALQLVRGAPLADAAPGQWHWAEELRTDMISCLRDIGVELSNRALEQGDLDLARWAAARALVAAPGDELLLAARIRTEHRSGNAADTERLTLQLAAQSRALGVDLDPATVTLLQEVMEGRVRARLA